jgi:diacylglycerol kinase (ATP)
MRVTLLHNPQAGPEEHDREALEALIEAEGHEVRYASTKEDGWKEALDEPADLVVAAGGDGTVSKVFKRLARRGGPPVTILPCGTANNIARSLGCADRDVAELVRAWPSAQRRRYDVGEVVAGDERELFVECAGAGLFGWLLDRADELDDDPDPDEKLERSLSLLAELLDEAEPLPFVVDLDGDDASGDYLAVEAMNARESGPNVPLAPAADVSDGQLDVVLLGPAQRDALAEYVAARRRGARPEAPVLPVRRGRRLRLQTRPDCGLHVDDDLLPDGCANGPVEVSAAASVTVLGP